MGRDISTDSSGGSNSGLDGDCLSALLPREKQAVFGLGGRDIFRDIGAVFLRKYFVGLFRNDLAQSAVNGFVRGAAGQRLGRDYPDIELPDACGVAGDSPRPAVGGKGAVLFFAAVVLLVTLWLGPLVLAFAYGNPERIVEYQGQTLLEVDDGFLDPHWSYYVCHGPLFRETERLYDEYEPLVHN